MSDSECPHIVVTLHARPNEPGNGWFCQACQQEFNLTAKKVT